MTDSYFTEAYEAIPTGYSEGRFKGRKYGLRKSVSEDRRRGNLIANELGGNDYISLNFYRLSNGTELIKPCEMPLEKVKDFVLGVRLLNPANKQLEL